MQVGQKSGMSMELHPVLILPLTGNLSSLCFCLGASKGNNNLFLLFEGLLGWVWSTYVPGT